MKLQNFLLTSVDVFFLHQRQPLECVNYISNYMSIVLASYVSYVGYKCNDWLFIKM